MIRLFIVDSSAILREALSQLLDAQPDMTVVGLCGPDDDQMNDLASINTDVVLLRLRESRSSLAILHRHAGQGRPAFVVLAEGVEQPDIVRILLYGARGVVPMNAGTEHLFNCIRGVAGGQVWLSRSLVSDLVRLLRDRASRASRRDPRPFGLTAREMEIIQGVIDGLVNKEIAKTLKISEETVKHHLSQVFSKLEVANRVELATFALKHDLGLKNGSA